MNFRSRGIYILVRLHKNSRMAYKAHHTVVDDGPSLTGGILDKDDHGGGYGRERDRDRGYAPSSSSGYGGGGYRGGGRGEQVLPNLNEVYWVEVKSIQSYGAFC